MGMPHVEDEPDLLAHVELIRALDAGDEGMGSACQVEIGFRPHGLDGFDHCLYCAPWRRIGLAKFARNVFRANAEDNSLADLTAQERSEGVLQSDSDGTPLGYAVAVPSWKTSTSPFPDTVPSKKFMGGEPMNPATKRLAGR